MNHTNESVIGYVHGEPIVVEQGPAWLAQLLYNAPQWAAAVTLLAFGTVTVALVWAVQRVEVDEAIMHEIIDNMSYIAGMGTATAILVEVAQFPYVVDVLGGIVVGWVLSRAVIAPAGAEIYRGIREQERGERGQQMGPLLWPGLVVAVVVGAVVMQVVIAEQFAAMNTHDVEDLCLGFFGCGPAPLWFYALGGIALAFVLALGFIGVVEGEQWRT